MMKAGLAASDGRGSMSAAPVINGLMEPATIGSGHAEDFFIIPPVLRPNDWGKLAR
jgi:hypothetical protein